MRVLVTGACGYIGPVVMRRLQQAGFDVIGYDTGFFKGCDALATSNNYPVVWKDVRDAEKGDFEGVDAIVHLAALSNDPMGALDAGLTDAINTQGTLRLAGLAKEAGVKRFVLASSCSAYGLGGAAELTEDSPLNPLSAYAKSKIDGERGLATLADDNFSPTYLRFATAYGGSPMLRFDLVVNNLSGWGYTTGRVRLMSDGSSWRPLIHVEDMASAFLAALQAPVEAVHNQALNAGQETENYQVRDIANIVAEHLPGCQVEFAQGAESDPRSYHVSFRKIREVLPGFQPQWQLRAGVQQLIDQYKEMNLTLEDFQSDKFTRLKHLSLLKEEGCLTEDLRWGQA